MNINDLETTFLLATMKRTIVVIIESIIVITGFVVVIIKPSLRGFEKAVAISVWQQLHTTQARHCEGRRPVAILLFLACHCESCLQLVAISVWGIIIHSWNSFSFLFLYWLLVVCGGLPPFVRGDVAKQQGG